MSSSFDFFGLGVKFVTNCHIIIMSQNVTKIFMKGEGFGGLTTSRQAKSVLRLSLLVIISTPHYYKYIENLVLGF